MGQTQSGRPKPGDLIEFNRILYKHWGVYVGKGYVIHLTTAVEDCSFNSTPSFNFCSDKPSKGVVKKELLSRLGRYKVGKKYEGCFPARPVTEILREAEGWVGRAIQYHLCSMNCEHFATWLRYGVRLSEQVQCCQKVIEMVSDRPSPLPLSSPQSC